jgi:uncharacterized protein (TIGR02099 family)
MATLTLIIRRARSLLWTAFSIIVILLAVGMGIGQLLMPYSVHYQPELEQWLSKEFGQPVAIDNFEGSWTAFGPRLTLSGLTLLGRADLPGEGAAEVVIESAALDIRPLAYLLSGRPLYNFRVIGARFVLRRDRDGQFRLSGLGVSNRGSGQGSPLTELARIGEVVLQDSGLEYIDEVLDIRLALDRINGRLALDGDDLATEVSAVLFDRRSGLTYGDVNATGVLRTGTDRKLESVEWHADAGELMLAAFQGKVPASPFMPLTGWLDAEIWGGWSRGSGHRINGLIDLRDALLANDYQDLHIERIDSRFRWRFSDRGHWNLHLADFLFDHGEASWATPRLSVARNVDEDTGLWISADELPLGFPLSVVRDLMSMYGRPWPEKLTLTADGQVSGLDLVLDEDWQLKMARGRLADASVTGSGRWPSVTGLGGEVELSNGGGLAWLDGGTIHLDWPRWFRDPLTVDATPCRIDISWGEGWQAGFQGCGVENEDAAAFGDLVIRGNGGKPAMDLNVMVSRGKVGQIDPYWPEYNMSDNVKAWLRRGLLDGELRQGRVIIRGDMDDFPFRQQEGRFDAVAWLERPLIDFDEDWPAVQGGDVVARFIGPGMAVHGAVEDTGGVAAQEIFVGIEDMKTPVLKVEYSGASDLPGLLAYLEETPLSETVDVDLSAFEFAGPADINGRIVIPLGESPGELAVDGVVLIDGGRFSDPEHGITISDIKGSVAYNERGFAGTALQASAFGDPARLDLSADADGEEKFRAQLQGNFDVRDVLLDQQLRADLPMLEAVAGRSDWRVSLTVAPGENPDRNEVTLGVRSGLEGVTMGLPKPFEKPAEETWPFALDFPLGESDRPLDIRLEGRALLRFDMPGGREPPRSALISLGGEPGELPPEGLLHIEGFAPVLDLDGWVSLVIDETERGTEMGGLQLGECKVLAGQMLFMDRRFPVVELDLSVAGEEISAAFESQDIDGTVRFSGDGQGRGSLSAEFERLALGEPGSTGVTMESDPKDLPALHLYARSLQYGGIELGETRIEAFPTQDGFRFEKADAVSDELSIQASGDWSLTGEGHRSDFRINMASESLGDFLHSMDISSSVQGGQTLVSLNAWWPGTPASFALSRLIGQVEFSVVDGNVTGADAGPGRLLGLVSFTALPKRLALDFSDVFESGFPFDEATGTFTMENGKARTEDVLLKSSSASIHLSGETDLENRRYDQLMTIRPGVGNTLPIIGALAAGPGGAAAGLALQGLLHDSLGEATQVRYTITGSWDEPVIEPVEIERAGG